MSQYEHQATNSKRISMNSIALHSQYDRKSVKETDDEASE